MAEIIEDHGPPDPGTGNWSMDQWRAYVDACSDYTEDWQGIPVLVPGSPLTLHDRHPMRGFFAWGDRQNDLVHREPVEFLCTDDDVADERIVNHWYYARGNFDVYIVDRDGKRRAVKVPRSPDMSMDRLTYWLTTLGASDAWDLDAEHKARAKLHELVSERQWRHYDLTGTFLETSPRSRLLYVFRRSRPTIALTPRNRTGRDYMRCLAVLCMHPIGYYRESWAGCMVPTDDLIAHLLFMRYDEAGFWREANQHEAWHAEAGL